LQKIDSQTALQRATQKSKQPTTVDIAQGFQTISQGCQQEATILQTLKTLRDQSQNLYEGQDLPPFIDRNTLFPSKTNLNKTTKFGKLNLRKSFTVIPDKGALTQVLLPIIKSEVNVCFDLFIKGYDKTRNVAFRILENPMRTGKAPR
jgi:hypothetical protein